MVKHQLLLYIHCLYSTVIVYYIASLFAVIIMIILFQLIVFLALLNITHPYSHVHSYDGSERLITNGIYLIADGVGV